ncbi:methyl-accepting chemotaxis protein [Janthinobacterium aquaticum]|uniref:methyl-accepting chemotaxis protein n=1 Tax=Janthinobacterium sp. FT58W TaxID=2654254 RepID=UPI001265315A|nr:methyl-accepting chemotaxis protein [Janthinobacterium sp. FT58W]KAB8043774.1 HAMP domain-containing protein [Janthinobacterium sp. FT58W]
MLDKLRIGPKLLLAPALVLLLLILSSASAWHGMVRQNASMENMVQVRMAHQQAALDVAGEARLVHAHIYQLLSWTNGSFARERLAALEQQIRQRHAAIAQQLKRLRATAAGDELALVDAAATLLDGYRKKVEETMEMAQADLSIAANSMIKAEAQFGQLNGQLSRLSALEKQLAGSAHLAAGAEFRTLGWAMLASVLFSIAASVCVTALVRRAMLRQIQAIGQAVGHLAAGNLSRGQPGQGRDEIAGTARVLDQCIARLNQTLRTILSSVQSIDTASREIAVGNMDLSARTEMQASSLEETASAMATLTGAVNHNADNARRAGELAGQASALAVQGGQAMAEAVGSMATIRSNSRQIVDIIGVIDAISFQTNILALNAAVEAARAGEQGRGFAVVAAEVRTLAQRSASAAREIKTLIATSVATIDGGSVAVQQAGDSMAAIVASVQQVNDMIQRVQAASAEQAAGITEVNLAVSQMDDVTQQNAALVEQAAAAAASLQEQAVTLSGAVAVFTLDRPATPTPLPPASEAGFREPAAQAERRAPNSPLRGMAGARGQRGMARSG